MDQDEAISKLLRLKRYEQPPEGYAQKFLQDFHRRQRADLLKSSPWESFWKSLGDMWPTYQVPKLAYAACAVAAIAMGAVFLNSPLADPSASAVAQNSGGSEFSLITQRPVTIGETRQVSGGQPIPASGSQSVSQHYVLQPRPPVTDRPLSF